jgi:hypothetical protein
VVVSEQIEVLKMTALTNSLVLGRLKYTAESKVRAFKELGSVGYEKNQTVQNFDLCDILHCFVTALKKTSERLVTNSSDTASTLVTQKKRVTAKPAVVSDKTAEVFMEIAESGDIKCSICSHGLSIGNNKILLCDGEQCTGAYHQQCLQPNVLKLPLGEWYCPNCSVARAENRDIRGNTTSEESSGNSLSKRQRGSSTKAIIDEDNCTKIVEGADTVDNFLSKYEVGQLVKACTGCKLCDNDETVDVGTMGTVIQVVYARTNHPPLIQVKWNTTSVLPALGLYKAYGLYASGYKIQYI